MAGQGEEDTLANMRTIRTRVNKTDKKTIDTMITKYKDIMEILEEHEKKLKIYNEQKIKDDLNGMESNLEDIIEGLRSSSEQEAESLSCVTIHEQAERAKLQIRILSDSLDATSKECEAFMERNYSVFMACKIVQMIAAGLLIAAGIMISCAKPCQLEAALQSIDLEKKPFFCKHNAIKNTHAVWGIGLFVLLSNIVLILCPCLHYNCNCKITSPKFIVWFTLFTSVVSAVGLVCIFLVYFIWEDVKHTDISYLDLQSSMISSLKTSFTSDEIDSENMISNAWNELFIQYECCAVNEVLGTTNDFDETPWCTTSGTCQSTSSQIPKSCCNDVTESNYQSAPSACHASVNSGTYKSSCISRMKELSMENIEGYQLTMIYFLALVIVMVQIADIFLLTVPLNTCCKKSCNNRRNGVGQHPQ